MSEAVTYPRRLIEVDLPIKQVSRNASREKSIHHGHISTMHIWWARRPLASCRAILLAAICPDPADALCPESFKQAAAGLMESFRAEFGGPNRDWSDPLEVRAALLDFIAAFSQWENSNSAGFIERSR